MAGRVAKLVASDQPPERVVEEIYLAAYARPPDKEERRKPDPKEKHAYWVKEYDFIPTGRLTVPLETAVMDAYADLKGDVGGLPDLGRPHFDGAQQLPRALHGRSPGAKNGIGGGGALASAASAASTPAWTWSTTATSATWNTTSSSPPAKTAPPSRLYP